MNTKIKGVEHMEKLEQLKEQIKSLSKEELEQLKAYLEAENNEEEADNSTDKDETPIEDTIEQSEDIQKEPQSTGEEEPPTEEEQQTVEDNSIKELKGEEQEPQTVEEETIPPMQKGEQPLENDVTTSNITDETGEELPIDYEQIIEAQNAKIAALQAENTSLKNKVEGAFGYSSKPATPAKVNKLYDDATDVHFHK